MQQSSLISQMFYFNMKENIYKTCELIIIDIIHETGTSDHGRMRTNSINSHEERARFGLHQPEHMTRQFTSEDTGAGFCVLFRKASLRLAFLLSVDGLDFFFLVLA